MKSTIWTRVSVAVLTCGMLAPAALSQQRQSDEQPQSGQRQQSDEGQQNDQDQQRSQREAEDRQGGESKARDTRQLKAIDLEHREPHQIQQILALKAQGVHPQAFGQPAQGFGGQAAGPPAPLATGPGAPGRTARGTPTQGQDHKQPPAIAIDAENKVLFVRGTQDQISEVEELVKAFDKPNDELEKHDIGETRLIPVSQQDSGRVRTTLAQLQLPHQMVSLGDVSLIAVSQGESDDDKRQAEQVEQVISKLQGSKKQGQETSSARGDSGNEAETRENNRTNTDDE